LTDQLGIYLGEFLMDSARGFRRGMFGGGALGAFAAAEIV
jgi:hypothetical protein